MAKLFTIIITVPLILYSWGVFKSRYYDILGAVKCFGIGIIFDYTGTTLMYIQAGGFPLNAHTIFGDTAIILITIDLIIGIVSLKKRSQKLERWFRGGALISWTLWTTSYIIGFFRHCPWIK